MITEGIYRHTYTSTASDITPLYRLTPNAMLMYFQDSFARLMTIHGVAAFDIVKQQRMWVITEVQMDIQPTVTYWSEDFTVEIWVSELTSLRIYCDSASHASFVQTESHRARSKWPRCSQRYPKTANS